MTNGLLLSTLAAFCMLGLPVASASAGDRPYYVTYDQTMEEPGNLEISARGLTASPQGGSQFLSGVTEFE